MNLIIIDRKYALKGKWFRFQYMRGIRYSEIKRTDWKILGWKIAIGRFELRLYK